eukprot:359736-Chlamydomonas_euryale.AAC.1
MPQSGSSLHDAGLELSAYSCCHWQAAIPALIWLLASGSSWYNLKRTTVNTDQALMEQSWSRLLAYLRISSESDNQSAWRLCRQSP